MPTMVRAGFGQLMKSGLRKIYNDALDYRMKEDDISLIFNEKDSDDQYEQVLEMAGTSFLQEKPENTNIAYQAFLPGGSKRVVHLTYGTGLRYSAEFMADDKYGITKKGPNFLAQSAAVTKAMIAWTVFNQGFTSQISVLDGNPLFYNQHTLLGGALATQLGPGSANVISAAGTYPNRPSVDMDLSVAALQLATNHASRMLSNQGFPIRLKWKYLIGPPELRFIAREILGSAGMPYTGDNTVNSLLPEDYKWVEVPWLTSASSWYLSVDKKDQAAIFYNRMKAKTDFDDDFDADAVKQKTIMRCSATAEDWRGLWGTQGP